MEDLKAKIKICPLCFKSFEGEENLCPICGNPKRDKGVICIVEKEMDLEAIEKTGKYKGLYFILGGTISGFGKEKEKKKIEERVNGLIERIKGEPSPPAGGASTFAEASVDGSEGEIILALNPTTEGQNTSLWLKRELKDLKIKTTQLALGLPVGGELEYADEETLSSAFESRR